jgi:hypothetical protein
VLVVLVIDPDQVMVVGELGPIPPPFEQVTFPQSLEPVHPFENGDLLRVGQKDAREGFVSLLVSSEHGEGIVVAGFKEPD